MPRIAAALAVLLTVVTCIGFNIAQYPQVRQQVASAGISLSVESEEPASAPEPSSAPPPAAASPTASPLQSASVAESTSSESTPSVELNVGAVSQTKEDRPHVRQRRATPARPVSARKQHRAETSPSQRTGNSPVATPEPRRAVRVALPARRDDPGLAPRPAGQQESRKAVLERPLVAVGSQDAAGTTDRVARAPRARTSQEPVGVAGGGRGRAVIERLPPVDQLWSPPGANNNPPLSEDTIPIYPSTGIE
jgi:hypothetical protein